MLAPWAKALLRLSWRSSHQLVVLERADQFAVAIHSQS
jgi:hypothetical protein